MAVAQNETIGGGGGGQTAGILVPMFPLRATHFAIPVFWGQTALKAIYGHLWDQQKLTVRLYMGVSKLVTRKSRRFWCLCFHLGQPILEFRFFEPQPNVKCKHQARHDIHLLRNICFVSLPLLVSKGSYHYCKYYSLYFFQGA